MTEGNFRFTKQARRDTRGKITKQGNHLIRKLLVQITWSMEKRNKHVAQLFEQISKSQKNKRRQAAISVAQKIFLGRWALLRDDGQFREPVTATGHV